MKTLLKNGLRKSHYQKSSESLYCSTARDQGICLDFLDLLEIGGVTGRVWYTSLIWYGDWSFEPDNTYLSIHINYCQVSI